MPALHQRLEEMKVTPVVYATQWYMTLFTTQFPFEMAVRVWDVYLQEGRKTIFRLALALMRLNEAKLMAAPEDMQIFMIFKGVLDNIRFDEWFSVAFG